MADPSTPGAAPSATPTQAPAAQAPTQPAPQAAPASPEAAAPARRNPYAGPPRRPGSPPPLAAPAELPAAAKPSAAPDPGRPSSRTDKRVELANLEISKLKSQLKDARGEASVIGEYADLEMGQLTDAQRAHVLKYAGESPRARLAKIKELRELGALAPPAQHAVPAGASTAPGTKPPAPAPENDPDVLAFREWERARSTGRAQLAATMMNRSPDAIRRGREKVAASN